MTPTIPPWGTDEALRWGIAHPDWPWHTPGTRAEYEYPTGTWWRENAGDDPEVAQASRSAEPS